MYPTINIDPGQVVANRRRWVSKIKFRHPRVIAVGASYGPDDSLDHPAAIEPFDEGLTDG